MLQDDERLEVDRYVPQSTLPGRDYYADDVFQRERGRIFFASWVCVAREEEIASSDAVVVREVVGESVLLAREPAGTLRASLIEARSIGGREDRRSRQAACGGGGHVGRVRLHQHVAGAAAADRDPTRRS